MNIARVADRYEATMCCGGGKMKSERKQAISDAFHAISLDMDMMNRTATLTRAMEIMQSALELLDMIDAHLPAARLHQAIKAAANEIEAPCEHEPGVV